MIDLVFKKYVPAAFNYITAKSDVIAQAARDLGISATGIGAAIAKENDAYETNDHRFADRRLDDYVKLQTFRMGDIMLRSEATAATALGLDEQLRGTVGKVLKLVAPTLADVGIANIKVSTAIKLLDDYLANYPADPLGLKKYQTDAGQFVRDLINPDQPTTALVSALMIKEAQDFYLKPSVDAQGHQQNIDPATWGAMSQEVRDGLTTMYFTLGTNVMEAKRALNIARNGFYDPRLGEGNSGGLLTVQNAAEIGAALGVTGYGQAPINGLDLEPDTTFVNLPNPSTGSSGLISYANDYSVRINSGGTLSHIVAAEAAKGNAISVADLRSVNSDLQGVADTAIPSGAVLLVPKRVGDSLVVDSGNARISFNPTTGEYLAITQGSTSGPTSIYERRLVNGTLVDRFVQTDSDINGLDLIDGNPTTLPVSLKDIADHTGSLTISDERAGDQLTALANEGNGNYQITTEIGGQSVTLSAVADNASNDIHVAGVSSINGLSLDLLGTGTFGLDADDYLSFGFTFDNLLNGSVGEAGQALIAGLNPATQAAVGAPIPQVQVTDLPDGQSLRSLEVAGGTTFSTLRDAQGNIISATYSRELGGGVKFNEVYDGAHTLLFTVKIEPILTGENAGQIKETLIRPDGSGYILQRGVDGQELANTRVTLAPPPVVSLTERQTITVLNDIAGLIGAIQGGRPLPILQSGLHVVNDLVNPVNPDGPPNVFPGLNRTTSVVDGLASLYNLSNALQHGDTLTQVSAGLNTLNFVNSALPALLGSNTVLSFPLNTFLNGTGTAFNAAADGLIASGNFNGLAAGGVKERRSLAEAGVTAIDHSNSRNEVDSSSGANGVGYGSISTPTPEAAGETIGLNEDGTSGAYNPNMQGGPISITINAAGLVISGMGNGHSMNCQGPLKIITISVIDTRTIVRFASKIRPAANDGYWGVAA